MREYWPDGERPVRPSGWVIVIVLGLAIACLGAYLASTGMLP